MRGRGAGAFCGAAAVDDEGSAVDVVADLDAVGRRAAGFAGVCFSGLFPVVFPAAFPALFTVGFWGAGLRAAGFAATTRGAVSAAAAVFRGTVLPEVDAALARPSPLSCSAAEAGAEASVVGLASLVEGGVGDSTPQR